MSFHCLIFPKPWWEPINPWWASSGEHSWIVRYCGRPYAYHFLFPFFNFWLKYPRLFEVCYRLIAFQLIRTEARNCFICIGFWPGAFVPGFRVYLSRPYLTQPLPLTRVWVWNKMPYSQVWKSLLNPSYVYINWELLNLFSQISVSSLRPDAFWTINSASSTI